MRHILVKDSEKKKENIDTSEMEEEVWYENNLGDLLVKTESGYVCIDTGNVLIYGKNEDPGHCGLNPVSVDIRYKCL